MKVKNQVYSVTIRAKLDLAAIRRSDYRSPLPSCLAEWDMIMNLYLYTVVKITGESNTHRYAHRRPKMPKKDVISTKPVKKQWSPRGPQEKKEKWKKKNIRMSHPLLAQ